MGEIATCIDLHGHSKKKNIFMYGCDFKSYNNPREFCYLMSKFN